MIGAYGELGKRKNIQSEIVRLECTFDWRKPMLFRMIYAKSNTESRNKIFGRAAKRRKGV